MNEIDRLCKNLADNSFFSSHNKAATALGTISTGIGSLTAKIEDASKSSDRLSRSLNRLTAVAVVIALLGFGLEVYKLFL